MSSLEAAAGKAIYISDTGDVVKVILEVYPDANVAACALEGVDFGSVSLKDIKDPNDLRNLNLMVCQGQIGVAENGAIWVPESYMMHRAAPFIAEHLVVVLSTGDIVPDVHTAYEEIEIDAEGFGVFIAGPSKTADIEQALVIGAHGPKSLTVFLVD